MKKISADLVITHHGDPIKDGVIIYDEDTGIIQDVLSSRDGIEDIDIKKGVLLPGYINTHCHLELSHLRGIIPTGTGLISFIKSVVSLRDFPQEMIDEKIALADKEMEEAGIVAVGDISNQLDTVPVKMSSRLRYYTFVEMFDLLQADQAHGAYDRYHEVYKGQAATGHHKKSIVPHAPYSVSSELWGLIVGSHQAGQTVSIHNQELLAENQLFQDKAGGFLGFFEDMGLSIDDFAPTGQTSIRSAVDHLRSDTKVLFVHNTMTSSEDISFAHHHLPHSYWVTCPNANLYIENKLPQYQTFLDAGAKVCIGTDSLSSNWQLSIYEEMKVIKKYQSDIDDVEITKWATCNGAEALGYEDLGMLKKGLAPGINLIDVDVREERFDLSLARSSSKIV